MYIVIHNPKGYLKDKKKELHFLNKPHCDKVSYHVRKIRLRITISENFQNTTEKA